MNNRDRLIELMVQHGLERRDVAELVRVDRDTVDCWVLPPEGKRSREVPDMAIELLTLKLAARAAPEQR